MSEFPFNGDVLKKAIARSRDFLGANRIWVVMVLTAAAGLLVFTLIPPAGDIEAREAALPEQDKSGSEVLDEDLMFHFEGDKVKGCSETIEVRKKGLFEIKENEFEKELYVIVGNHPIKEMVPYIAEKDRIVAAFLVGIAKKESNWGKRVPLLNGQDCYNYWGYKGHGTKGSVMGYGCFSSPSEAINEVGGRIEQLVAKNLDTPGKMIVWKCGSSCAGHDPQGVSKWISDVSIYFNRISNKKV